MTAEVEKRKAFLINLMYFAFFIAAFYLFMKYLFGIFAPILFAFVIAMALQKPVGFITKKTKLPRGPVSAVMSLLVFAVIIALVVLVGVKLFVEIKDFAASVMAKFESFESAVDEAGTWISNLGIVKKLPAGIRESLLDVVADITDKLASSESVQHSSDTSTVKSFDFSVLSTPLNSVWSTAKQIPSILIGFVVTIVATCFMTSDYGRVKEFIFRQFPGQRIDKLRRAKRILFTSIGKIMKAYGLIILITTVELAIGLYILTLCGFFSGEYVIIISFIIALIDIVPVLGTGTVLIPWALYSLITGNFGMGIGLLVVYVIILVIRQIIEPKLVAGQVDVSPILTISAMYIGTKLFGVLGIFILPLVCIVVKLLNDEGIIHIFNSKNHVSEEKPETPDGEN